MKISVEIKDAKQLERIRTEGREVEIYMDGEGLEFLLAQLLFLKNGKTDHIHLMTSAWGGGELSREQHNATSLLVEHLTILLVSE